MVGRVEEFGRWSGVVASTTRMKHCFMCRPSLQDPWRSCRKPHLLPWSGAIGPQPDPNKHHPFFHHRKKKRLKEKVVERGEEGERLVQKASAELRVSAGRWWGVEEPRKGNHRRITSVGLRVSARLLPFGNRYIDILTLCGEPPLSRCFLPHSTIQNPFTRFKPIITLVGRLLEFRNYSTWRCLPLPHPICSWRVVLMLTIFYSIYPST